MAAKTRNSQFFFCFTRVSILNCNAKHGEYICAAMKGILKSVKYIKRSIYIQNLIILKLKLDLLFSERVFAHALSGCEYQSHRLNSKNVKKLKFQ